MERQLRIFFVGVFLIRQPYDFCGHGRSYVSRTIFKRNSFPSQLIVQLPLYLWAICFMISMPYPWAFLSFFVVITLFPRTATFLSTELTISITMLLTKYIGDSEAVTVYGSYKIDGKEYTTRLQDGVDERHTKTSPFWDNTTIKSLTFVDGVKVNNCSSYFSGCTNLETIDLNGLDTRESSRFCAMFAECRSLQSVDLTPLNMDKLTELYGMFSGCESLTELDFSMVDTSNVTSFDSLFSECRSLQAFNIKGMNTGSATYLASVFDGCESLTSIDVSGFDTSSLTDMGGMFSGCENLTTLNLDSFDTVHVRSMETMFADCKSLKQLDISHFTTKIALTYTYDMFKNCDALTAVYVNQDFYNFVYSDKVKNRKDMFKNCPITDFTVK